MRLSVKLPLYFALTVCMLVCGALYGLFKLNAAIAFYQHAVHDAVESNRLINEAAIDFAASIQEWKNVLLRGKDEQKRATYWDAHTRRIGEAMTHLKLLHKQAATGPVRDLVARSMVELEAAQARYASAYAAYQAADHDFAAGDRSASGADRAVAKLLDELEEKLRHEELAVSDQATSGARFASNMAYGLMLASSVLSMLGALWLTRQITVPLRQAVTLADKVAQGDLTGRIALHRKDELGQLLHALRAMQDGLVHLVEDVRQGAEGVATASQEIAQGNQNLSVRTEQQASALQQTAASVEELSARVRTNADNARHADHLAAQTSEIATQGGESVRQVIATMANIQSDSRKIADIIGVINGIAFQTNILALNAAVEAARAGTQGRGFAVVATEVRALAARSASAAKEISSIIDASVTRIDEGSDLAERAGATIDAVVHAIHDLNEFVGKISAASAAQDADIAQLGSAVSAIDEATQQNAALVEEMAAAASGLSEQADDLVHATSQFRLQADSAAGFS